MALQLHAPKVATIAEVIYAAEKAGEYKGRAYEKLMLGPPTEATLAAHTRLMTEADRWSAHTRYLLTRLPR